MRAARPPGHHVTRSAFGGSCYLNNCAIAAQYLDRGFERCHLDIDAHHGNGAQAIFWNGTTSSPGPCTSIPARAGSRTSSASPDETDPSNLNVPLPPGSGDDPGSRRRPTRRRRRAHEATRWSSRSASTPAAGDPNSPLARHEDGFREAGPALAPRVDDGRSSRRAATCSNDRRARARHRSRDSVNAVSRSRGRCSCTTRPDASAASRRVSPSASTGAAARDPSARRSGGSAPARALPEDGATRELAPRAARRLARRLRGRARRVPDALYRRSPRHARRSADSSRTGRRRAVIPRREPVAQRNCAAPSDEKSPSSRIARAASAKADRHPRRARRRRSPAVHRRPRSRRTTARRTRGR